MFKSLVATAVISVALAGAAQASTILSGSFFVQSVNATGLDRAQSRATISAAQSALTGGGSFSTFSYDGAIDFGTTDGTDATTIADWLASGSGTVTGLDATYGALQQSKPSIRTGTATTTFYFFFANDDLDAGSFDVRHDDGINLFESATPGLFQDSDSFGSFANPTGVRTSTFDGFGGDEFGFLYVATNGDPSVLEVSFTPSPVPLPAALPLLLAGIGGLTLVGRRRAKAAA